jgi:hypothetical protein
MRPFPIVSDVPSIQRFYEALRSKGESHSIAEILAFRQVPGSKTDRELFRGRGHLADQFKGEESLLGQLAANARREGVILEEAGLYEPAIARYPLDPKAVIPPGGGRSYIRSYCEEQGLGCEGMVKVKSSSETVAEREKRTTTRRRRK